MIKYTITISENGKEQTAYINSPRPLIGDEPIVRERFAALEVLLEPEDEYTREFKKVISKGVKNG